MAFATLIQPLATSGSRKADGTANASGKVYFYHPSSTIQATVYADADASATLTQPVSLPASGKATVYCTSPVRVLIQYLVSGTTYGTLDDYTFIPASAGNVGVANDSWTGTDPDDGSIVAGGHTNMDAVLTYLGATVGGSNGLYKESTGATARTIKAKFSEISVSVKDYGAVGNGLADDTTAIQAAVNRVASLGGGIVYFPPGTYLISAAITLASSSGVSFIGAGPFTSTIKQSNATANALTLTTCSSFQVSGLFFSHSTTTSGAMIALSACSLFTVQDVFTVADFKYGLDISGASSYTAVNRARLDVTGAGSRAIRYNVSTTANRHSVTDCILSGTVVGIEFDGTTGDVVVQGNKFSSAPIAVSFAATLTGTRFDIFGNVGLDDATTAFDLSALSTDPVLRQSGNGVDGYSSSFATGTAQTPNRALGPDIRLLCATGGGGAVTVNAPVPAPTAAMRDVTMRITYVNTAGATTWTHNAIFVLAGAVAIPTTIAHSIVVVWKWDPDTTKWREQARSDGLT